MILLQVIHFPFYLSKIVLKESVILTVLLSEAKCYRKLALKGKLLW